MSQCDVLSNGAMVVTMVIGTVAQNVSLLTRYVSPVKSLKVRELEQPGTLSDHGDRDGGFFIVTLVR